MDDAHSDTSVYWTYPICVNIYMCIHVLCSHRSSHAPDDNLKSQSGHSASPRRAAQDAEDELARYSVVAGSGSDAYAADKEFLRVERQRSSAHRPAVHSTQVPTLRAASDLLTRYGELASAGVAAYHSDSASMQSAAVQASEQESAKPTLKPAQVPAVTATPIKIGTSVRVLSPSLHWRSARVEGNEAGNVLVHYAGYKHKYDEWVAAQSHRMQGLASSPPQPQTSSEKAKDEVAKEFSRYEQVAVSGQNAYKHDTAAAVAGTKWDNHKQYVRDEMRGDMEAQKTTARYSNIARLGTTEDEHTDPAGTPKARKKVEKKKVETDAVKVPQMSVVQVAAQAAANAAASVVDEAKAAVAEVEGSQASQPTVSKQRPQEQVRAKNGGAEQGRGRLGDSTDRTYAKIGRLLSLAGTTARAEGNVAVSRQVAQEKKTLAKLRHVPGKLPARVQHNLVSAGASLLRRLGIGAGAQRVPQSTPLTANDNNAVLTVASESEGPAKAKMRAILHLHQLHARAHAVPNAVQQRLSEESRSNVDDGANVHTQNDRGQEPDGSEKEEKSSEDQKEEKPADEDEEMKPKDAEEEKPAEEVEEENTSDDKDVAKRTEAIEDENIFDEEETKSPHQDEDAKPADVEEGKPKPADVQPSVVVEPPISPAEERRLRKEKWEREHQVNQPEVDCDTACQHRKRSEEWDKIHPHGKAGHKEEHQYEPHHRDWQTRKISPVPSSDKYSQEDQAGSGGKANGCWVPDLPETREALCTPTMYKDGTCEQVWGDVPEITGAIEAFALQRIHVPADSSKIHLEVITAPFTQMHKEHYGSISVGYQKRADGATWQYKSRTVASSGPWSTVGFFENAPDMLVKDCEGGFLGVISMDPLEGKPPARHEAEVVAQRGGVYRPTPKLDQPIRARILGNTGKEALTVIKGGLDVLGDNVGLVRYHLYTTDTRRLVCIMERREHANSGLDWVIRLEKGGPLDIRVAGVLAAQFEAETMHKVTDMKVVVLVIAFILLGLLILCCLLPIVMRWWNEWRSKKRESTYFLHKRVEERELPHAASRPTGRGPEATASGRGDLSARSLASSYAQTATSCGMTARTDGADTALSTGREYKGGNFDRGDFWDRLPALDEPTPRGRDFYQAPLQKTTTAASLRGLPHEDVDKETKVRALLAQHPGRLSIPRKGWEATSFRDTQRSYREHGGMEIRDVLHNVLDPVVGGENGREKPSD